MDRESSLRPATPWYRQEPWLAVLVVALAVMTIAPLLPEPLLRPTIGGGVLLTLAGLIMLALRAR